MFHYFRNCSSSIYHSNCVTIVSQSFVRLAWRIEVWPSCSVFSLIQFYWWRWFVAQLSISIFDTIIVLGAINVKCFCPRQNRVEYLYTTGGNAMHHDLRRCVGMCICQTKLDINLGNFTDNLFLSVPAFLGAAMSLKIAQGHENWSQRLKLK